MRRGETVLEIGGGIGEIELELLSAGAERATNVELSGAYEPLGNALLGEQGLGGRIDWRYGDVAVDRDVAPAADVVVLNRVVCCYPDMPALVDAGVLVGLPGDVSSAHLHSAFRATRCWSVSQPGSSTGGVASGARISGSSCIRHARSSRRRPREDCSSCTSTAAASGRSQRSSASAASGN